MGMMVDPKYGGSGLDTVSYVIAMEEISKIDASASVVMSVNNSLVCWGLQTFGTEEQKQEWLPKLASGEIHGAFCLSEPEAGSDATSQKTTAIDKGDYYLVIGNGSGYGAGSGGGSGNGIGGGYSLGNRRAISKPAPKYTCNEEGKVVVEVSVDRNGKTVSAIEGIKGTTNTAKCLLERSLE